MRHGRTPTRGRDALGSSRGLGAERATRGVAGVHVENFGVRVDNGKITEYQVNLKVAFGIERTKAP